MSIQPANRIKTVEEYYFSTKLKEVQQLRQEGKDIINLGIGNPDFDTNPEVIKELVRSSTQTGSNYYQSYRGLDSLRQAFADWYKNIYQVELNPENEILPLMGSKEGIMHISMAFANPGDRVLIPNPGYPAYTSVSGLLNLDVQYYNLNEANGWVPEMDELECLCNEKCKIIWLNYPHMPSGAKPNAEMFKKLVKFAKARNILLAHDNPYSLINNDNPQSILAYDTNKLNVVELNSLSKSHNMAGWRVGCVVGGRENINHILRVKSNFDSGMFKPIQEAAIKALQSDILWFQKLNKQYEARRKIVTQICDKLGCEYQTNTAGLFVWAKIPQNFKDSRHFSNHLLYGKNIFTAPGFVFGSNGDNYIRISLCAPENQLKEALKRIA